MATVQKSSKINFYKLVQVKDPSTRMDPDVKKSDIVLAKSINTNTRAINNLGETVNSLGKVLVDLKKVGLSNLEAQKKDKTQFKPKFTTPNKEKKQGGLVSGVLSKSGSFLEGLLGLFGNLFKIAVVIPVLKWLSNPKNQDTIVKILDVIKTVVQFIFDWAKWSITTTIDGLYDLLKDDATWQERLLGFGKAIVGIGSIVLGIRYLKNPTKLIKDIYTGVRALIGFVTGGGGGRRGRPRGRRRGGRGGGLAKLAAGTLLMTGAGVGLNALNNRQEEKSQGGSVKNLPSRSQGGFIDGPQSGYKVSLDGGRSTSFIGHGREYVARKANGGAFVIPLNTPGTKTQPHLTKKRLGEAKSQGYKVPNAMRQEYPVGRSLGGKLPQFSQGGAYLNKIKANDGTSGANANKQIFLHWSGGHRSNTEFHNGNGYHTFIPASGQPVRKARFGQKGRPYHTYGQNQATSAAIAVSGMNGFGSESASSWGPQAITPNQYKGMAREAAGLATAWGWKPSDINDKRVRTHYEDYRDRPDWYLRSEPSHYRWDLNRLYAGDPEGSGPGKIRNMIKQQMAFFGGKTSKTDDPTRDGSDNRNTAPWNPFAGALDAITGNMFDFDGAGKTTPPKSPTPAPSGPARTVAKADASVKVEPLPANFSDKQAFMHIYNIAKKVGGTKWPEIVAAQAMHETGYLKNPDSVYFASGKTNAFGQTGNRGHGVMPRPGDPSGWTKYPSLEEGVRDHIKLWHNVGNHSENYNAHDNIMDGIAAVAPAYSPNADPANIRLGYTVDAYSKGVVRALKIGGFDPKATRTGAAPAATTGTSSSVSSSNSGGRTGTNAGSSQDSAVGNMILGGPTTSVKGGRSDYSYGNRQAEIKAQGRRGSIAQMTEERNQARQRINERTREMVGSVIEQVGQSNGMNSQLVAQANAAIQAAIQAGQRQGPPVVVGSRSGGGGGAGGGGGSGGGIAGTLVGTAAALLGSSNNPLRGIFK
jgi:hypothetical protein